ncbi:hypothetical protein [Caproicibacter fermentans]|nr:hypothetical protein [Caproicibacter fermentans]
MEALKLTSSAFQEGGRIPVKYSARGLSPCFSEECLASASL